jgi:glycosyltransferase involved in cell wall biosynthesis
MKVITCVRTRNEARFIRQFIEGYSSFSNEILVADGMSEDDTVSIALSYPNVYVKPFDEWVVGDNEVRRNPEGRHYNFLIQWAEEREADWIFFDDCDSFPSRSLKSMILDYIITADKGGYLGIKAYHVYLYLQDQWFPDMNIPGKFLWGWKRNFHVVLSERDPWGIVYDAIPPSDKCYELGYPYSLLHYSWTDEELIEKKLKFYNDSGKMGKIGHPLLIGGHPEPKQDWMTT